MTTEGRAAQRRQRQLVSATIAELEGAGAYPTRHPFLGWDVGLPATDGLIRVAAAAHPNKLTEIRTWMRQHRAEGRWTGLVHPGWRLPDQARRTPQIHMPFEDFASLYGRLEFLERDYRRVLDAEPIHHD